MDRHKKQMSQILSKMQTLELYNVKVAPVLLFIGFPHVFISWHKQKYILSGRTWAITWLVPPECPFAPPHQSSAKWLPQAWAGAGWRRQHAEWSISGSGKAVGVAHVRSGQKARGLLDAGRLWVLSGWSCQLIPRGRGREREAGRCVHVCLCVGMSLGSVFAIRKFDHLTHFAVDGVCA